jgi:hypothetical protein
MGLEEELPEGKSNIFYRAYAGIRDGINYLIDMYRENRKVQEAKEKREEDIKTGRYHGVGDSEGAHWQNKMEHMNRGKW